MPLTAINQKSTVKVAGGKLSFYSHQSVVNKCTMSFSVFEPPQIENQALPVLYWLSGLTCTEENFMIKAAAWRYAAEHGVVLVAPDTSPRGLNLEGEDESWDLGTGAGFYVNATQAPWQGHYNMYDYIVSELPEIMARHFHINGKASISGHSMGGHGALMISLRNPGRYQSVSAFAPICAPMQCPWGEKAFTAYLGADRSDWVAYDTCELIRTASDPLPMLVDQGSDDNFLDEQLKPNLLMRACAEKGVELNLRMQPGYDHSYYFIATFIGDHIAHHARHLKATS